jgi:glyoxylase-like metal-dependent hydrolase (beta-lactamase superfamily II)
MMRPGWLALLGFVVAAAVGAELVGAEPVTVAVTPVQVGPHSWYVQGMAGEASAANQGFMSNAGFVITSAGVVVFDTLGSVPLAEELIRQIRKLTAQPIKRVIVSHYHADHIYGLQAFKATGAEIWAYRDGRAYLASDVAQQRLAQRRAALPRWIDERTQLLPADRWLGGDEPFELGGVRFDLQHVGPAHSPEDLAMLVSPDGVLYSGDLIFTGRIPFVGDTDSKHWLAAIDRLERFNPKVLVPGHGPVSRDARADLSLTRDYLTFLRETLKKPVEDLVPFDDAYRAIDWSRFARIPAFDAANRGNAYNTYLLLEKESLQR